MGDFIKSWKFMAIIVGLLTVAAIAGVIYGVTTHTEPGLMAGTPGFGSRDVPINVCPGGYVPDIEGTERAFSAAQDAVNTINQRLGLTVLQVSGPHGDGPCGITVLVGVPSEHSAGHGVVDSGGAAVFDNGSRHCAVTTTNTGTDELLGLVLQHELGHCLGLAHDDYELSIMRPVQSPTPDGAFPPRISDSDRELLRRVFSP
jgi:hypothetical protein